MPNITTNHAIICLYHYPQKVVIFTCRYFKLSRNTATISQSNDWNFSCSGIMCWFSYRHDNFIYLLQNNRYGYYIHGRSVHGRADTNMWQMNEQLKREEEDLCGKRGLEPNTERQTFEMEVPVTFREQYDDVVRPLRQGDVQLQRRNIPNNPSGKFKVI